MAGETVVLTGAAGGVGQAAARILIARNYVVYAGFKDDWESERLNELKSSLGTGDLIPVRLDLRDQDQIDAVVARVERSHPALRGILANGAQSPMPRPLEHMDIDLISDTLDINVVGNLRLFKRCLPLLEKNKGRIVFTSSIFGKAPGALQIAYAASKHADEACCRILRQELKRKGITISVVNPGVIARTWMAGRAQQAAKEYVAKLDGCSPEDVEPLSFDVGNPAEADFSYQIPDPYYRGSFLGTVKMATIAMQKFSTPESVADKLVHALETRKPKANYFVGLDCRVAATLNWLLPVAWMDKIYAAVGVK